MFAAIYIPDFRLQAVLRHGPASQANPVALIDTEVSKPVIIQLTAAAELTGVAAGLTASMGLARCANLEIKTRDPAQEKTAMEIVVQTAYAFSPNVEATQPGICTLELKGLGLDNFTAKEKWASQIIHALAGVCLQAKIGMAATPDLALLAAQGRSQIAIIRDAEDFVASLPIAALSPAAGMADILSRWGIRTAGEFLALAKSEVCERLGAEALDLFARVSPTAVRPLKLIALPEHFSEQIDFETEIETAEPLLQWIRRFSKQLCSRLQAIHLVVAQVELQLKLASGSAHCHAFKVPSPTGEIDVLFRMLQTHLETVRAESPVVALQLTVIPAKPGMHQFGLFQNTLRDPNQFADTTARLTGLVGSNNVGTPVNEPTHRPDAFQLQPPNFEFVPAHDSQEKAKVEGMPFRRFRPPLPAQFHFSGEKPAYVRSGNFNGRVADVRGPYLSSGNWWDDSRWAREEWDVQLTGGALLRLFRSHDGCFVEGVYD